MSHSAVSMRMSHLEGILGVRLLEFGRGGSRLIEAGEQVAALARACWPRPAGRAAAIDPFVAQNTPHVQVARRSQFSLESCSGMRGRHCAGS
jgi:DNA-binding transcriptional LysR family regulator